MNTMDVSHLDNTSRATIVHELYRSSPTITSRRSQDNSSYPNLTVHQIETAFQAYDATTPATGASWITGISNNPMFEGIYQELLDAKPTIDVTKYLQDNSTFALDDVQKIISTARQNQPKVQTLDNGVVDRSIGTSVIQTP